MKRLKIGVIGVGHMGMNHVRILSQEQNFFDLVGIYDTSPQQVLKLANEYGTKGFDNMDDLLSSVDSVVVAVPSSLHCRIGMQVAEKGVHALIEKPIAPTENEARQLVDAFEQRHLKLAIGHVERFNPAYVELKKLVDSSEVFYVEARRYSSFNGGGRITDVSVIEDLMIHDIDLVLGLMSPHEITDIRANGEKVLSEMTDFATVMLDYGNRAHAIINASRVSQNKERSINIQTKEASINANLLTRSISIRRNTSIDIDVLDGNLIRQNGIIQELFVPSKEPLREELIAFQRAVTQGADIEADGRAGLCAVEICDKVKQRLYDRIQ